MDPCSPLVPVLLARYWMETCVKQPIPFHFHALPVLWLTRRTFSNPIATQITRSVSPWRALRANMACSFDGPMALFNEDSGVPVLDEVQLRPKSGFHYIYRFTDPEKANDWRADNYPFKQNGKVWMCYMWNNRKLGQNVTKGLFCF